MEPFFAFLLRDIELWIRSPIGILLLLFQLWMLIDAIRRREWIWAVLIFVFSFLTAILYYFFVYRQAPAPAGGGFQFEWPGAQTRKRIKELEARIHHLDKPHHYLELGDIYFKQGKLVQAEECYRAALERDPEDIEIRAHLGRCLLEQNKPGEARPLLEQASRQDARHEYGETLMALGEALERLGEREAAIAAWQQVLEHYTYARARVKLAELYLAAGEKARARALIEEVLSDAEHASHFQRKQERAWLKRARQLQTRA